MAGSLISRRVFVAGVFAALGAAPQATGRAAGRAAGGSAGAGAAGKAGADGVAARPGGMVLRARPATVSLGRRTVSTWAYGDTVPGPLVQVAAGGTVDVRLINELPAPTTVHWHGIRIDPRMDGAPGFSQAPTRPGRTFDYVFTAPDPGTYFYHSHVGMQADRGLYGPLIVTDPNEPLGYDEEFTVVLDDWLDGIRGGTPDAALRRLNSSTEHDDTLRSAALGGVTAELRHPAYLVNGRGPDTPETFACRPGWRARFRVINAAADTAFRVALGGHRMTVTHTDGFPCVPVTVDTFIIGMGERYDFVVTLGSGAFPLVAVAEGKRGRAYAVVRTTGGAVSPPWNAKVPELDQRMLKYQDLDAGYDDHLPRPARTVTVTLGMRPSGNEWTLNGRLADDPMRVRVDPGETIRLILDNKSPMWHPMHLHGHTFQLRVAGLRGPRKDTVNIKPRERLHLDVLADNPGEWMFHCHNLYHQEQGMMGALGYGPPPPGSVHAGHPKPSDHGDPRDHPLRSGRPAPGRHAGQGDRNGSGGQPGRGRRNGSEGHAGQGDRNRAGGHAGHGDRAGSGERGHHARGRGRPHTSP